MKEEIDKEFLRREIECDLHNINEAAKISGKKSERWAREFQTHVKRIAKKYFGAKYHSDFETCLNKITGKVSYGTR